MTESWQTCIHQADGLCPDCLESFQADPNAWIEYGDHPQGIANWQRLLAEMENYYLRHPPIELKPTEISDILF